MRVPEPTEADALTSAQKLAIRHYVDGYIRVGGVVGALFALALVVITTLQIFKIDSTATLVNISAAAASQAARDASTSAGAAGASASAALGSAGAATTSAGSARDSAAAATQSLSEARRAADIATSIGADLNAQKDALAAGVANLAASRLVSDPGFFNQLAASLPEAAIASVNGRLASLEAIGVEKLPQALSALSDRIGLVEKTLTEHALLAFSSRATTPPDDAIVLSGSEMPARLRFSHYDSTGNLPEGSWTEDGRFVVPRTGPYLIAFEFLGGATDPKDVNAHPEVMVVDDGEVIASAYNAVGSYLSPSTSIQLRNLEKGHVLQLEADESHKFSITLRNLRWTVVGL